MVDEGAGTVRSALAPEADRPAWCSRADDRSEALQGFMIERTSAFNGR
jgi:hypothetical protein